MVRQPCALAQKQLMIGVGGVVKLSGLLESISSLGTGGKLLAAISALIACTLNSLSGNVLRAIILLL